MGTTNGDYKRQMSIVCVYMCLYVSIVCVYVSICFYVVYICLYVSMGCICVYMCLWGVYSMCSYASAVYMLLVITPENKRHEVKSMERL